MQSLGPAPPGQCAASEFINDNDFAIGDDVVHVFCEQVVCAQAGIEVVDQVQVLGVVKAVVLLQQPRFDHQLLDIRHPVFGEINLLLFLIDRKIAFAVLTFFFRQDFGFIQAGNQLVDANV